MVWKVGSRVLPKMKARATELGPGVIVRKEEKVWVVLFDKGGIEKEFTGQQLKKENSGPLTGARAGATSRSKNAGARNASHVGSGALDDHDEGEDNRKYITSRPQPPNIFDEVDHELSEDDDGDSTNLPPPPPKRFGRFMKGSRVRPRSEELRQYVGTILRGVGKSKWRVKFDSGIVEQEVWTSRNLVRASLNDDSSISDGSFCLSDEEDLSDDSLETPRAQDSDASFHVDEDGVEVLFEQGGGVSVDDGAGTRTRQELR